MLRLQLIPCKRIAVLAAIVFSLQHAAEAQSPAAPESVAARPETATAKSDQYILQTYQVGDLVLDVPDYPYPGASDSALGRTHVVMGGIGMRGGMGMGGMGGMGVGGHMQVGQASAPGPARITTDDLTRVLVTMVAPNTWAEVGGEGGLQHLGASLVVRQTEAVHQQIEGLLEQLRQGAGKQKTMAIDVRWLLLDSDDLERLTSPDEEGNPQVDRKVLDEYTRRPSSIRGLTNCFTGQLVYLVSGTRRNVVSSFIPVVGSIDRPDETQYASLHGNANYVFTAGNQLQGGEMQPSFVAGNNRSVGYQPVVERPNFGTLLEIRPTLIPDDFAAIVDLRSTLTTAGETSDDQAGQPPQNPLTPTVDRIAIETQELATTLYVQLRKPMLVGGLTRVAPSIGFLPQDINADTDAKPSQKASTETPQLYLILEVR